MMQHNRQVQSTLWNQGVLAAFLWQGGYTCTAAGWRPRPCLSWAVGRDSSRKVLALAHLGPESGHPSTPLENVADCQRHNKAGMRPGQQQHHEAVVISGCHYTSTVALATAVIFLSWPRTQAGAGAGDSLCLSYATVKHCIWWWLWSKVSQKFSRMTFCWQTLVIWAWDGSLETSQVQWIFIQSRLPRSYVLALGLPLSQGACKLLAATWWKTHFVVMLLATKPSRTYISLSTCKAPRSFQFVINYGE